ncbi:hypothetical protein Scep_020062 [Stephania cephalantha]|uniref:Uncharacterized protein n=1 Tax=Stephania cephalantha TaxID=152367 RepID=A0AAP0IC22_9MAGN
MQWIEGIRPAILHEEEESIDLCATYYSLLEGWQVDMNQCRSLIGICYETM